MNQFKQAVVAHLAWKVMFEQAIHDGGAGLVIEAVAADDRCPLGQWVHGQGARPLSNPTALQMLCDVHSEFHLAAARVLEHAQGGRVRDAVQEIANDDQYRRWSSILVAALQGYADAASADKLIEPLQIATLIS